jgi:DNA-binding NarL/FixJ family response regulator
MNKIRVILVDDHKIFSESLKILLEAEAEDIEIVGIAYDGREAVECAEKEKPDIILMDVRMPNMNGVEATRKIMKIIPEIKIVVLTTFDDDEYVYDALRYGAVGYLLKEIPTIELITALRAVKEGVVMISPAILKKLIRQSTLKNIDRSVYEENIDTELVKTLTNREKEILKLMITGFGNNKIANNLFLSEQTVKNYVSVIYSKLGIKDRLQLIRMGKDGQFDNVF